jgi:malonyl-CoA O-methyltransferase
MPGNLPLVLLPGWGFDHRIWDEVLPLLREHTEVIALDESVLVNLPPRCVLMGWSLGGMLATQIAIQHPERVAALITVGSNLKWVTEADWPGASADNFAAFFENLAQNFEATKQHFCGVIARGDDKEKQVARILRTKLSTTSQENLLQGLRLLDNIDNRQGFAELRMPGLHLFGENDAMVPLAVEQRMRVLNKKQRTHILQKTAHAPFLSQPEKFSSIIKEFIQTVPYQLDKNRIAESFSRAATTYDGAAQLQREIGEQLWVMVPECTPKRVLDLGCGTGVYSQWLQQKFPQAQVISLDIAMGMLQEARSSGRARFSVCGDAESLPLQAGSVEVIFSNLAIQWCQQPEHLFAEIYRVLAPGGVCLLSTFVPGTLRELEIAWQQVDSAVHTNRFFSADELCSAASAQGFENISRFNETCTRYYGSVSGLMRELKAVGARNLNAGRRSGLMGKRKLIQLARAYEPLRQAGHLPGTYEVLLLVLKKEK